ncbi:MAG: hypothetical protein H7831_16955 [Magnetococcus sp. WYHC-3]
MILLVVIAALVWIFWYFKAEEVRNIVRWIRYSEMWLISGALDLAALLGIGNGDLVLTFKGDAISWRTYFEAVPKWDKTQLTYDHLSLFGAMSVGLLRYIFSAFCVAAAVWCMFKGPRTHFRNKLGLEGLITRQAQNFPVISPFVDFNPSTQPPRPPGSPVPAELPAFAEALGPEEWLAYNRIPAPDGKIDEEAAGKAFQRQLYGRWKGAKALKPYQQILLAAFCLKASRKRNEADEMLGRVARCWTHKKGLRLNQDRTLLRDAQKVLRNKDLAGNTLAKCNRHAFVTTALLRALATAREEGGVLAPATFVWLRGHDRVLWYPLNNLGRQSFHMEAVGAMAHYKAEKMTDRPIPIPKMQHAVETIVEYMSSRRARPIPQLDYSHSKKRGVKKAV